MGSGRGSDSGRGYGRGCATSPEAALGDIGEIGDIDQEQAAPTLEARKMPQGIRDSIEAVSTVKTMAVVTAICPCIGALATGVRLDVHIKLLSNCQFSNCQSN